MTASLLSTVQAALAQATSDEAGIAEVLRLVGEYLRADRCFLYVRDPALGRGRIAFSWRRTAAVSDPRHDWQDDTTDLPRQDPLFRAALAARPSVYVQDVETAPPTVLNRAFEHETFGHRALIHAHITHNGQLWGILQPCVFGHPRTWTPTEQAAVESVLPELVPIIRRYMRAGAGQAAASGRAPGPATLPPPAQ
ncbi:GAF domain-containing protein [Hymenobacter metallilatus]|uniref:GAF domain-containing protein n=1 Tax=Hymenobacter metallilatus TaxID=2493666 RepID=A0A3R9PDE1_9BACT|nr:GAF domain-containing protein [Hymenobacter metallilatus]RSK34626.1 GAF domain-containing protein [Hymenobacter metallilatus]